MDSVALRAFICASIILVPAIGFGIANMPKVMGLAIGAGVAASIFVNVDKIATFSGFGVKAEMRQAIKEAYATTEALKRLAEPLMLAAIDTLTYGSRFSGVPWSQKHEVLRSLDEVAGELSLQGNAEISAARSNFFRLHTWDHYNRFESSLRELNLDRETADRVHALKQYDTENFPTEDQIVAALGPDVSVRLGEAQREALRDYMFYRDNRRLRSPDVDIE